MTAEEPPKRPTLVPERVDGQWVIHHTERLPGGTASCSGGAGTYADALRELADAIEAMEGKA